MLQRASPVRPTRARGRIVTGVPLILPTPSRPYVHGRQVLHRGDGARGAQRRAALRGGVRGAADVPVYWIMDSERRCVEVWSPVAAFPVVEWEVVSWQPAGAAEALSVSLDELLRPI
jgi:hypothetical protein